MVCDHEGFHKPDKIGGLQVWWAHVGTDRGGGKKRKYKMFLFRGGVLQKPADCIIAIEGTCTPVTWSMG